MRPGSGVGIEPRLIGLIGRPLDEAGMMVLNENRPLIHRQMPTTFSDGAVFIKVAFVLGLAVGVSASIHRIGQDLVECVIGGSYPADRTRHAGGDGLQRKRQTFGTEPEPDPSCRAEFCESLEDRADRAGDRFIGMKEDFTILVSPNQTNRQAAAQFSASYAAATVILSCFQSPVCSLDSTTAFNERAFQRMSAIRSSNCSESARMVKILERIEPNG